MMSSETQIDTYYVLPIYVILQWEVEILPSEKIDKAQAKANSEAFRIAVLGSRDDGQSSPREDMNSPETESPIRIQRTKVEKV